MNSNVNSIRREQKKLRRCMRRYRKKLRGDKIGHKPFKFGWIANSHPDDGVDYRKEFLAKGQGRSPEKGQNSEQFENFIPGQLQEDPLVTRRGFASDHFNPLQAQVEAFLKAPNIRLKKKSVAKGEDGKKVHGKGRRRFVLGSGKIRSSERVVREVFGDEDGFDTYSMLSDSSDEEGFVDNEAPDTKIEGQITTPSGFRRMPTDLIRSNSGAYFKPINMSSGDKLDPDFQYEHGISDARPRLHNASNRPCGDLYDVLGHPGEHDISFEQEGEEAGGENSGNKVPLPPIFLMGHRGGEAGEAALGSANGGQQAMGAENPQAATSKKKDSPRKGISFGDIAKLQHGLKTKKLFHLVDQLAQRHGIGAESMDTTNSKKLPPVHARSIKKINFEKSPAGKGQTLGLEGTPYSSVFYAMKYGYSSDSADPPNEPNVSLGINSTLKVKNDRLASNRSVTDSGIDSELTQTLSARFGRVVEIDEKSTDLSISNKKDETPSNESHSNRPRGTHTMTSDLSGFDFDRVTRHSSGQEDIERSLHDVQTLMRHRGTRYQRQRRRESMMEASHFVNSLWNKDGSKKTTFSSTMGSFNKRRESVAMGEDETEMTDMNKVDWSSAMSRIKLVHTLADLRHII